MVSYRSMKYLMCKFTSGSRFSAGQTDIVEMFEDRTRHRQRRLQYLELHCTELYSAI